MNNKDLKPIDERAADFFNMHDRGHGNFGLYEANGTPIPLRSDKIGPIHTINIANVDIRSCKFVGPFPEYLIVVSPDSFQASNLLMAARGSLLDRIDPSGAYYWIDKSKWKFTKFCFSYLWKVLKELFNERRQIISNRSRNS